MRETPNLHSRNIFAIPSGCYFGLPADDLYIIYAPLAGQAVFATADTIAELEQACTQGDGKKYADFLTQMSARTAIVYDIPQSSEDLYQVDLLLNYKCNFHCVYCYSAQGRSSKEISFEHIANLIDYLFADDKVQHAPYIINFSGGGEPLVSFDLVRKTVEYIKSRHGIERFKYTLGLVTNGSLITSQIVDYLEKNGVELAVSFEILKDLQDAERGMYEAVSHNIKYMLDRDFSFGIRTTFTPASVRRMCEMIEELHHEYPKIRKVVFDTVLAPELFETPEDLRQYYDDFLDNYYIARQRGETYGIKVESIAADLLSMVRTRTCAGKIVLTPMGTVSSCARVSSPKEALYDRYLFGDTNKQSVELDDERLSDIMNEYNIHSYGKCKSCFARWNCGGGCRLFHDKFPEAYDEVRCNYVRKALTRQLSENLGRKHLEKTGETITETLKNHNQ